MPDLLEGLLIMNPGLKRLDGYNVIVRSDIAEVQSEKKVTLLSGGGSGHEPAHAGNLYFGKKLIFF